MASTYAKRTLLADCGPVVFLMLQRIGAIAIAVNNLDEATDHYARLLGIPPTTHYTETSNQEQRTFFCLQRAGIELRSPLKNGQRTPLSQHLEQSGEGIFSLSLVADDLIAFQQKAQEKQLRYHIEAQTLRNSTSQQGLAQTLYCLHPDGTRGIRVEVEEHNPFRSPAQESTPTEFTEGALNHIDHMVILTQAPDAGVQLFRDQLGTPPRFGPKF